MSTYISVIGIGPGGMDYVLPLALKEIRTSDVLIGGKKALNMFDFLNKESLQITGDLKSVISYLENLSPDRKAAVLVSGDPGFYSFLNYLKENLPSKDIRVIPGISSFQVAFAHLQASWHDAYLFSLHGRRRKDLALFIKEKLREFSKVAFLTDSEMTPNEVARVLLQEGFEDRKVFVLSDLTLPAEQVKDVTLSLLAQSRESGNSVVVFADE
ncbi:precorrin-6y C5,15-methyltransferase (decarboxylating) subunit CbiE [Candidatus Contubernalis alkaliaceticus]|uniref:precorrin-6y C5,15-methyltransferase (decarboxylating) subunit CbiE n=1 Tax=Candidatus Contubernalis alkaliaceticus TaxID=338645 RepID=UPI001F4BEC47|nr:precorrin-6y C5,15-methyltransferase (decarboxylating) subunit CbiE [Candidatus Contubernalis alkalaceticus]UNC92500.1 precorrin-6y C5,15-methyltransferase (decarboxylating) subunit CbiE [Candidatus Contubernalis alkalaceticus]